MHALILLYINQHTKFEVSSFANYEDMIGGKIKTRSAATAERPCDALVSKFVLCFTRYGRISKNNIQDYLMALAMVPFDRPHTISS